MFKIENRKKRIEKRGVGIKFYFFGLFSMLFAITTKAQCAMCRAVLTSEGNTKKAEAVNDGIVFLMAVPYVLVGIVGYIVYQIFKKKTDS
jgi:uncharacterized membrane protein